MASYNFFSVYVRGLGNQGYLLRNILNVLCCTFFLMPGLSWDSNPSIPAFNPGLLPSLLRERLKIKLRSYFNITLAVGGTIKLSTTFNKNRDHTVCVAKNDTAHILCIIKVLYQYSSKL